MERNIPEKDPQSMGLRPNLSRTWDGQQHWIYENGRFLFGSWHSSSSTARPRPAGAVANEKEMRRKDEGEVW